jgi:hypothetical protein
MSKYVLDYDHLEIGDIILSKSDSEISQLVRRLTGSQYSHARLYVGDHSCIDSDGYGVQANNTQRILFDSESDVVVLRLKGEKTIKQIKDIEFSARQKIGTEYSTSEAKIAMLKKEQNAQQPNRQFCTRFVAQAYHTAGFKLVPNPNYCLPENLLTSDLLRKVNGVAREASKAEINFANTENPLLKQAEVHNNIFKKSRQLSNEDIQTFEQLSDLIISNPEYDEELTDFVEKSGYLTFTELDKNKNPWNYDAQAMIDHYKHPEMIFETALHFAETESHTRERFLLTIYSLKELNKAHPRKYFLMLIDLYSKLIDFSYERENAALQVLKHL